MSGLFAPSQCLFVSAFMPIHRAGNIGAIAFDLAADRAVVSPKPSRNLAQAELEQLQVIDDIAFF
jgi:hypothetical protein